MTAGVGSVSGAGGPSSAWLVAAQPIAIAVIDVASKAPAVMRRRNPSWVRMVFVEVFMGLIVHPAKAAQ